MKTSCSIIKNPALILFLLLLDTSSLAQSPKLKITHLKGDFYVYTTYQPVGQSLFPSNSMYLVTDAGVVLFDTPWDATQLKPLMDSIFYKHQKKIIMSISTHFHADRTAGVEALKQEGVKTYSSRQTFNLCRERKEEQPEYHFSKDTTFTVGGHTFRTFYPGEGHTKDNIVLWFPKDKILYGGCFVKSSESGWLGNVADANVTAWKTSVENVMRTFPKPDFVIPGHQQWTDTGALQHTLNLLKAHKP